MAENYGSGAGWSGDVVKDRLKALDLLDKNAPGLTNREAARRLNEHYSLIGPFAVNWVARRRGDRKNRVLDERRNGLRFRS